MAISRVATGTQLKDYFNNFSRHPTFNSTVKLQVLTRTSSRLYYKVPAKDCLDNKIDWTGGWGGLGVVGALGRACHGRVDGGGSG